MSEGFYLQIDREILDATTGVVVRTTPSYIMPRGPHSGGPLTLFERGGGESLSGSVFRE